MSHLQRNWGSADAVTTKVNYYTVLRELKTNGGHLSVFGIYGALFKKVQLLILLLLSHVSCVRLCVTL